MDLLDRIGVAVPVVGAGLGGGLSTAALTIALGRAGALGQIGFAAAHRMRAEMRAHREADAGPLAVNLLLPFARRGHWEAAADADVVVTFWGRPHRRTDRIWVHQCGSVGEALAAVRAGADGVIVQGVEAGGHVRGTTPARQLADQARSALPDRFPVWLAGGIATADDVRETLAAGADAVVAGTAFLMTEESAAHPAYKARLAAGTTTVLTDLFGAGWPAPHRVLPNAATDRWLGTGETPPRWLDSAHRATAPVLARAPGALVDAMARRQRPGLPLLTPLAPTAEDPESLVDAGALYAGESVARLRDVLPAATVLERLVPG